jgi:UDP-N-acetylglucosamine 2-epimerase (non-hydrolysing)
MIDTLDKVMSFIRAGPDEQSNDRVGPYGVVTLHRPSNVDDRDAVEELVEGLRRVSEAVSLVFPVHPRGRARFEAAGLSELPNVDMIEPIGYVDFVRLMSGASLVLTDSGGIQEETTVLGIPCLTLRTTTERPITVTNGTNRLVPSRPDDMFIAAKAALDEHHQPSRPPLWDGAAGERIAAILAAGS